jgi:phage terminase Nu1 subunit (DNA packaging protein)
MPLSDPRPYPRLTLEPIDRVLREVARYFTLLDCYRTGQQGLLAPTGEQLELFSSERLYKTRIALSD